MIEKKEKRQAPGSSMRVTKEKHFYNDRLFISALSLPATVTLDILIANRQNNRFYIDF